MDGTLYKCITDSVISLPPNQPEGARATVCSNSAIGLGGVAGAEVGAVAGAAAGVAAGANVVAEYNNKI